MNQAIRKLSGLLVLPVLLVALLLMPVRAKAAEYACDAAIPVSMELNGTHDEKFEVTIELAEKADPNTPMPAEEACSLLLGDGENGGFSIRYTEPGDYFYVIRQTAGSTGYMTYDDTVYAVQVQVTNDEGDVDGDGKTLKYAVTAYDASIPEPAWENKVAELSFLNTYAPPAPSTPKPDDHPDIAEGIANGTWGGAPTATPGAVNLNALLPQTSDDLPLTALVVVLVLAAAAIVVLVVLRVRKNKQDGQK